jgi:threonine aldolase
LVEGDRGRITASDVIANINPDNVHFPRTTLVVAENTCNRGGGSFYDLQTLEEIGKACVDNRLKFHLDGARLFNALVETGTAARRIGEIFDSVSICLSKGLGAPVGSVLVGDDGFIYEARRKRKVMGGGMRQAGYLAAAGLYALQNNIERLKEDHKRALLVRDILQGQPFVKEIDPVNTNILIFTLHEEMNNEMVLTAFEAEGLLAVDFGPQRIRMVTHLDFSDADLTAMPEVLNKVNTRLAS